MIGHDGVGADFDGKNTGEVPQSADKPRFAVRVVSLRDGIVSAEEGTADTSAEAMVDSRVIFVDVLAAWQSHGSPRFDVLMANPWNVPINFY